MKTFAVFFHEDAAVLTQMSPAQMQEVIGRYRSWLTQLRDSGHVQASAKLTEEGGKHLRRGGQGMVSSDGPFVEGKDVVTGLFILQAQSYEDAQARIADCPHLDFGWMELREIEVLVGAK
jgi:hypothetical protein